MRLKLAVTMIAFIIIAMVEQFAYGQSVLPEHPQPQQHEKHFNKTWYIFTAAAAADFAASAYDTHITEVGIHSGHGCYEANQGLVGKYPSSGALYAKNMGITGGIVFAG